MSGVKSVWNIPKLESTVIGMLVYQVSEDKFKMSFIQFSHDVKSLGSPTKFLWKQRIIFSLLINFVGYL